MVGEEGKGWEEDGRGVGEVRGWEGRGVEESEGERRVGEGRRWSIFKLER